MRLKPRSYRLVCVSVCLCAEISSSHRHLDGICRVYRGYHVHVVRCIIIHINYNVQQCVEALC